MQFDTRGGKPNTYLLGRGRLYISGDVKRFSGSTAVDGSKTNWRDVGNVTNFTVSQESESKEHRSSLQGIQVIDLEVPVSQKMLVTFAVDEINVLNLARFFSGELLSGDLGYASGGLFNASCVDSTTLVAGVTGDPNWYVDTNTTDQVHDMWYDLDLTTLVYGGTFRAVDFQPQASQAITVRKQATSRTATDGTVLTEGTHYELDRKLGRIRFYNVAGGLTAGDTIQVRWAAPTGDTSKNTTTGQDAKLFMIKLLTTSSASVSLMFVSENPNNADEVAGLEMFKVKLKPDGEFAGIGDDWATLSFTGALESVTNPPPGASAYGRWIGRTAYST